jgi:hypothetical protein
MAVYIAARRASPGVQLAPPAAEFKELSVIVAGKPLPNERALTTQQRDEMLYMTAGHGSPAMLKWLLLIGGNPRANAKDRGYADRSALREAARQRHCENESILITKVGDIARATTPGTKEQREERVAEVVATYVNESDPHWLTALHDAVDGGKKECVEALLAAGARVDAEDENGVTPLAMAEEKHPDLVPMLTAALETQTASGATATKADASSTAAAATSTGAVSVPGTAPTSSANIPSIPAGSAAWQPLSGVAGIFRMDLDRSGSLPQGQGRVRIVAEQNGHTEGKVVTFEYDCGARTMNNLTTAEWKDGRILNEQPATSPDPKWGRGPPGPPATEQITLNALCGVTIDTGRALGTSVGWKTLGKFDANELQILPSTRTAGRAQYRFGNFIDGGFSGLGWIYELQCSGRQARKLREQVWQNGEMIRDEVALANTWVPTIGRGDLPAAIADGVCPKQ